MKPLTRRVLTMIAVALAATFFVGAIASERGGSQSAAPAPIRVAAVGDSITFGEGVEADSRELVSYPGQLQTLLGSGYQVINFGYIGATLRDAGDQPYRKTDAYAASLESAPDVVVIMLGSNDSKKQNWDAKTYESELAGLITTYRALPSAPKVFVMTPPAATENKPKIDPEVISKEIAPIVRKVGAAMNAPVIDVYAATLAHPDYFPDGVHPDKTGAGLIATTVQAAILS